MDRRMGSYMDGWIDRSFVEPYAIDSTSSRENWMDGLLGCWMDLLKDVYVDKIADYWTGGWLETCMYEDTD